jgi:hypothetical protein
MTSLTIQLEEPLAEAVRQIAVAQQRAADDIVRDALTSYVESANHPLPKGIGKYHSGQRDTSIKARELIREAASDGQWP